MDPSWQDRDRVVDAADEKHEAHKRPGRDLGPVSEDEDQDRHQHPNHRPIKKQAEGKEGKGGDSRDHEIELKEEKTRHHEA